MSHLRPKTVLFKHDRGSLCKSSVFWNRRLPFWIPTKAVFVRTLALLAAENHLSKPKSWSSESKETLHLLNFVLFRNPSRKEVFCTNSALLETEKYSFVTQERTSLQNCELFETENCLETLCLCKNCTHSVTDNKRRLFTNCYPFRKQKLPFCNLRRGVFAKLWAFWNRKLSFWALFKTHTRPSQNIVFVKLIVLLSWKLTIAKLKMSRLCKKSPLSKTKNYLSETRQKPSL